MRQEVEKKNKKGGGRGLFDFLFGNVFFSVSDLFVPSPSSWSRGGGGVPPFPGDLRRGIKLSGCARVGGGGKTDGF